MNLQYISDYRGKTTGVFIPIQEWENLKTKFKGLEEEELGDQSKEEILEGLREAVEQLNLVKKGKLKARPAKELLDEL
jgi:redox-regulated HSP33 family molecular chaperone